MIRTLLCRWGAHWACGGSSVHKCECGARYRRWCECGCHEHLPEKEVPEVPYNLRSPAWRP